jgi:hypothetical protein
VRGRQSLDILRHFRGQAKMRGQRVDRRRAGVQAQQIETNQLERANGFAELRVNGIARSADVRIGIARRRVAGIAQRLGSAAAA